MTVFADFAALHQQLTRQLTGLEVGEFVRLIHELPPDQQPVKSRRGLLGRRREVRVPSVEEYFAQVLAVDEAALDAELSGSTYAGGHHPLDEAGHRRITDQGWRVSGDADFPGHAGGVYAMRRAGTDPDGLAAAICAALEILGARPEVDWSLSRSR